jgi:hypothetical protein
MNGRLPPYVPALAGLICGILSTVPVELRFVPAMLLWGGWDSQSDYLYDRDGMPLLGEVSTASFSWSAFSVLTLLRTPRRSTIRCSTCWRSSSPPLAPSWPFLLAHD